MLKEYEVQQLEQAARLIITVIERSRVEAENKTEWRQDIRSRLSIIEGKKNHPRELENKEK